MTISRRGFLGALTAIVAAPRALFARTRKVFRLRPTGIVWHYRTTFITAAGETPADVPHRLDALSRLYGASSPDGPYTLIGDVPPNATGFVHDESGGYFVTSDGRKVRPSVT